MESGQLQDGAGRQELEVLCPMYYGRSRVSQMLAELFCSSLHCVFVFSKTGEKKPKKKKKRFPQLLCAIKS
jgi:hypothetical protein